MDPRGNKYFHYYPNLTVSNFLLKFYINIHILMHPLLLIKEAYFCSRLWLKQRINLVNTEQISDYNVKSLKWNTYTTPHVSRHRGHCRKGCKKSCESQRRGKCSKKNVFWLQQTSHSGGDCMGKTCIKNQTSQNPGFELGVALDVFWMRKSQFSASWSLWGHGCSFRWLMHTEQTLNFLKEYMNLT